MAQAVAAKSFAERIQWDQRVKPALITLAIAAVAYAVGTYMMAPRIAANQASYLPAAFAALPAGAVLVTHADGSAALLPVRVADTADSRNAGLKGVGAEALTSTLLLYSLTRETTNRQTYMTDGIRGALEYAAIDATGTVVSITPAAVGGDRVSIAERHQWLIAAKAGTLGRLGVAVGSTIDPKAVQKY
jgi:uncharacterized membrane protein (UPF0127 family)